jgi:hypothetical protein
MKFTRVHIHQLIKKKPGLLLAAMLIALFVTAQDSIQFDTAVDSTVQPAIVEAQNENHFTEKSEYQQPDSFGLRQVPGDVVDSLKKDDAFWYADYVFNKKKVKENKPEENKPPHQWLNMTTLIIIVVLFLAILLWYLFRNNIIRRSPDVGQKKPEEEKTENIFDIDYGREIGNAIKTEDYRLAIRLMFLRLLKDLAQKNIIQYKQERTNFDYLSQVYKTSYYHDFFRITRNYEYVWYGKFEVNADTFGIIKNEFENFDRRLS